MNTIQNIEKVIAYIEKNRLHFNQGSSDSCIIGMSGLALGISGRDAIGAALGLSVDHTANLYWGRWEHGSEKYVGTSLAGNLRRSVDDALTLLRTHLEKVKTAAVPVAAPVKNTDEQILKLLVHFGKVSQRDVDFLRGTLA